MTRPAPLFRAYASRAHGTVDFCFYDPSLARVRAAVSASGDLGRSPASPLPR